MEARLHTFLTSPSVGGPLGPLGVEVVTELQSSSGHGRERERERERLAASGIRSPVVLPLESADIAYGSVCAMSVEEYL
jgi:hypothetical protein